MAGHDPAIQETKVPNYFVYSLASKRNGTLYIGVTNSLARRFFTSPQDAIQRETNLKKWPRKWKLNLIEKNDPEWLDLYETLV